MRSRQLAEELKELRSENDKIEGVQTETPEETPEPEVAAAPEAQEPSESLKTKE
jgi:hypothetical protein